MRNHTLWRIHFDKSKEGSGKDEARVIHPSEAE